MGIPTREPREGERYSPQFRMYTSDAECGLLRIQYHCFEAGSALPELMRTVPHAAFKVSGSKARRCCSARTNRSTAFASRIQDGEAPVELIETTLTDEQIWRRAESGNQASMYRQE
ncbi:hypothetical protein BPUN_0757 [Candidatus Paraburkholderia kirkii]|nr:hypothetical protein BPUN_0757 [Candidatus Paraburkholderia kirkii]